MIHLHQMAELMNDDEFDEFVGQTAQGEIEHDVAFAGTAAPARFGTAHRESGGSAAGLCIEDVGPFPHQGVEFCTDGFDFRHGIRLHGFRRLTFGHPLQGLQNPVALAGDKRYDFTVGGI